jgi:hypothetical protein
MGIAPALRGRSRQHYPSGAGDVGGAVGKHVLASDMSGAPTRPSGRGAGQAACASSASRRRYQAPTAGRNQGLPR